MADTDWTNEELASIDRIPRYNILDPAAGGDAYSFGGDGYLDNQMRQTVDALIVARGARRMALSASSAAILAAQEAASAKAERIAAQNAATDAYNSAQAAAGKVGLAAAEVDKAKAEVGKAKAEADRAQGYASGLNLPAVTAEMAGRFLKVNAAGTAYELGLITVATAADISAGTGLGFANAQTLGPILQGIKDTTNAAAGKVSPIGSYLLWPQYAKTLPGDNWLEAKGQIVSLVSYPDLQTVIPAYPLSFDYSYFLGSGIVGGGADGSSSCLGISMEGSQYIAIGNGYVVAQETGSDAVYASITTNLKGLAVTPCIMRPMMRGKELYYFAGGSSSVRWVNATSAATISSGEQPSTVGNFGSLAQNRAGDGFYKLPNSTIIIIASMTSSYDYKRVLRLRSGQNANGQIEAFDPPHGGVFTSGTGPEAMMSWQIKSGAVFIATRPRGSSAAIMIYRTTDGFTWTTQGSFNFSAAFGGASADLVVNSSRLWRQGQARRPVNLFEESDDGQFIVLNLTYGFLVSRNGGASWSIVSPAALLGYAPTYYGAGGNDDSTSQVGFRWSKAKGKFYFVAMVDRRDGGSQGATQTKYAVVWTSADLVTFTKVGEYPLGFSGNSGNGQFDNVAIAVNNITVLALAVSGSTRFGFSFNTVTGAVAQSGLGTYRPLAYLERISEEFTVFEMYDTTNRYGLMWVPADETLPTARTGVSQQSYGFPDFNVNTAGTHVGASNWNSDSGIFNTVYGPIWGFNPATERKLPNLVIPLSSGGTQFSVSEQMRVTPTPPRVFMRVK